MAKETNNRSIYFDVVSEPGVYRSYAIEPRLEGGWEINQRSIAFDEAGDDNDEEADLGEFSSATEIADAIDEAEEEF